MFSGNITLGGDNIIDPTALRNQILSQNLSLTSDVVDWLINATLNRSVGVRNKQFHCITKTCPCNIQRTFSASKISLEIFLIFSIVLLKT